MADPVFPPAGDGLFGKGCAARSLKRLDPRRRQSGLAPPQPWSALAAEQSEPIRRLGHSFAPSSPRRRQSIPTGRRPPSARPWSGRRQSHAAKCPATNTVQPALALLAPLNRSRDAISASHYLYGVLAGLEFGPKW